MDHHLRPEPPKNLPFHPAAGEFSPIQLRAAISSQVTASASRPPNFTFPSIPVRQCVLISHRTPARASRPDNLTFSTPQPDLPSRPSIFLPLEAGEVLPARQSYYSVFTCPTQRVLISRWTPARCSWPDNLTFFCLYLSNTASLDLPLDAGEVLPARQSYFFCLYLSNTASINLPLDAGEVLPASQTLFRLLAPKISNPVERDIPGRFGNLSFQSTTGEVRPPGSRVSISRQMPQEPPGWTTSPFPPSSAKLTHQTGGHAHQLDVG